MAIDRVTTGNVMNLSAEALAKGLEGMSDAEQKALFDKMSMKMLLFIVFTKLGGHYKKEAMDKIQKKLQTMRDISAGLSEAATRMRQLAAKKAEGEDVTVSWADSFEGIDFPKGYDLKQVLAFIKDPETFMKGGSEQLDLIDSLGLDEIDNPDVAMNKINDAVQSLGDKIKVIAADAQKLQSESTTHDELSSSMMKAIDRTVQEALQKMA